MAFVCVDGSPDRRRLREPGWRRSRMRLLPGAALLLLALPAESTLAETCEERFVHLLVDGNDEGAVKIHATQEIKGGPTTKNWFLQVSPGHWMSEPIEPPGQPWVLTYDNAMYTSTDGGKSWTKLRDTDSAGDAATSKANLRENAKTTRNAVCGEETVDGNAYETVEADYDTLQNFKTENHFKYWVEPASGFIARATYAMKGNGFESFTTQLIERAPGLTLPTP